MRHGEQPGGETETREPGAEIRLARNEDGEAIAAVGRDAWEAAYRGLMPDDVIDHRTLEYRLSRWRARRARPDPNQRVWVIECDGDLRGFCAVGPTTEEDADSCACSEIVSLYLHPDDWGRGLARGLLDHALEDVWRRGYREVRLWCLATNRRARRFYERAGFGIEVESAPKELQGHALPHTRYRLQRPPGR